MTTTPTSVAAHNVLHSTAIVSIKLPKNVTPGKVLGEDGTTVLAEFLHFAVNLPGGKVNVFIHSTDVTLAGTTIRARVEVKQKTTEGGRQFIFVDLHPVDKSECPTHRLAIIDDTFEMGSDWLVWPTPNMRGYAALIGPDEKLVKLPVAPAPRSDRMRPAARAA